MSQKVPHGFEIESAIVLKCCNNIDTFAVISLQPPQHHHPTPSLFLIPTHLSWNQFMHKLHWVMFPPVFKLQSSSQYLSRLMSAFFALLVDGLLLDAPVVFLLTDVMFLSVPAVSEHARAFVLAIVMLSSPSLVSVESSCEGENGEFNVSPINNVLQSEPFWELGITFSLSQTVSGSPRTWTQCEQFSLLVTASVFLRPHTLRASLFIAIRYYCLKRTVQQTRPFERLDQAEFHSSLLLFVKYSVICRMSASVLDKVPSQLAHIWLSIFQ